jgi:hypothetical protein
VFEQSAYLLAPFRPEFQQRTNPTLNGFSEEAREAEFMVVHRSKLIQEQVARNMPATLSRRSIGRSAGLS